MNRKSLLILMSAVVGLILLFAVMEYTDRAGSGSDDDLFLAGFRESAANIQQIELLFPENKDSITIRRDGDTWIVDSWHSYPADTGQLRQLVSSLAEARIVEEKTSDPDRYAQLHLDDPESGGDGRKVVVSGDGFSYEVILGKSAQRNYRYVRIEGDAPSFLVDRELEVSDDAADWVLADIVDLASDRVRKVTIRHADGETLVLEKSSQSETNFSPVGIPENRELSYASVGNGIAGALSKLALDDVRPASDADPIVTTTFETWDGLRVAVQAVEEDEATWLSFAATAIPINQDASGSDSDETDEVPADEAEDINSRLASWQYRVADYKKNLLLRRWEDILKAE